MSIWKTSKSLGGEILRAKHGGLAIYIRVTNGSEFVMHCDQLSIIPNTPLAGAKTKDEAIHKAIDIVTERLEHYKESVAYIGRHSMKTSAKEKE